MMYDLIHTNSNDIERNDNMMLFGCIFSPHGLKGLMKARFFMSQLLSILPNITLYIADRNGSFIKFSCTGVTVFKKDVWLIKLDGVDNKENAAIYTNNNIFVDAKSLPDMSHNDMYYSNDLVGCNIVLNEQIIGLVKDIYNYGASDILKIVTTDNEEILLPFTKQLFVNINIDKKSLVVSENSWICATSDD